MIDRSPRSGISRKRNRRSAAQPARAGRVGLNVGRSADRRRWLGAPLAHEDLARTRVTGAGSSNRVKSMPPVWRYPVPRSARPAPRRRMIDRSPRTPELQRSPPTQIQGIGDGGQPPPRRRRRVALFAGGAADRRRSGRRGQRGPRTRENSARISLTRQNSCGGGRRGFRVGRTDGGQGGAALAQAKL